MTEFMILLPWPDKSLSPNSRKDRRAVTAARRTYREAGFFAAKEVRAQISATAHLEITFYPPDSRRRDLDNMLASIKPGLDGIAQATCGDDAGWSLSISRAVKIKGGAVLVCVRSDEEAGRNRQ